MTDIERGQIKAYMDQHLTTREIAKKIGRSQKLVVDAINRGLDNSPGVSSGRKRMLSDRDDRNIVRHASNNQTSVKKIKCEMNLSVSKRTVYRSLLRSNTVTHKHMVKRPKLTEQHVNERYDFAHSHITWLAQWQKVIFSDEKKFNLDGPDGWDSYWHDLLKEEVVFSHRKYGGGGVKVWLGMSHGHKAEMAVINGTLTSKKYIDVLSKYMKPLYDTLTEEYEEGVEFQQDNDSTHSSNATLAWIEEKGITLLGWPPNSPDLYPMENIFGEMSRLIYAGNRHYTTMAELSDALHTTWEQLVQEVIQKCINSLNERMIKVIEGHGGNTRY